jgi:hypothetical protein
VRGIKAEEMDRKAKLGSSGMHFCIVAMIAAGVDCIYTNSANAFVANQYIAKRNSCTVDLAP